MEKPKYPVKVRQAQESDLPFVYSTWLKSYRQSDWAKEMSNDVFFSQHKTIVASILESENVEINIVCGLDDEDALYGYIVAERVADRSLVHFMYCKYNFRKLGIMSNLVRELGYFEGDGANFITHLPRNYQALKSKFNLEYSPYLLFK